MKLLITLLAPLLLAPLAPLHAVEPPAKQPNVVLFLVDDMGWMDCGAYGSRYYQTPHIDAVKTNVTSLVCEICVVGTRVY